MERNYYEPTIIGGLNRQEGATAILVTHNTAIPAIRRINHLDLAEATKVLT